MRHEKLSRPLQESEYLVAAQLMMQPFSSLPTWLQLLLESLGYQSSPLSERLHIYLEQLAALLLC